MASNLLDSGVGYLVAFGYRQVSQIGAQTGQFVHPKVRHLHAVRYAELAQRCAVAGQILDSQIYYFANREKNKQIYYCQCVVDKSDYLTGDVDASAKVEARELGTAAHNHLNARVFQTDAVRQVQVLQLQVQLRPRIGAQIIGVAIPVVAAGPQRAGVDAGDL